MLTILLIALIVLLLLGGIGGPRLYRRRGDTTIIERD
jgi:hypothetical protein